jgi:protein-disulfide isomerase
MSFRSRHTALADKWVILSVVLTTIAAVIGLRMGRPVALWAHERWAAVHLRRTLAAKWQQLSSAPSLGRAAVPPALAEFSDYECPYCRVADGIADSLLRRTNVTIAYHHFPIPSHPAAEGASRAAICAERQGRFQEMHRLMTTEEWRTTRDWASAAEVVGVSDLQQFGTCLKSAETNKRLKSDRELALSLKVIATPTFFTKTVGFAGAGDLARTISSLDLTVSR